MTRPALMKIIACLLLFALSLAACFALDAALASGDEENGCEEKSAEQSEEQNDRLDERSLFEAIESGDLTSGDLAEHCLDVAFEEELPSDLVVETLDPAAFEEAFYSASILGFVYRGSVEEAAAACQEQLEDKGWLTLSPQEESGARSSSFMKTSGTYRWLTLQYFATNDTTTVVINTIANR